MRYAQYLDNAIVLGVGKPHVSVDALIPPMAKRLKRFIFSQRHEHIAVARMA